MKKISLMFFCTMAVIKMMAGSYEVVTISNDPNNNELLVYNSEGKLIQTLSTGGKGGVGPHIVGGGIAKTGNQIAVINYNSQNVTVFAHEGGVFKQSQTVPSLSKPVSCAFGNNHLYILGTNTIESHAINQEKISEKPDGQANLLVNDGSAAQVGVIGNQLIASERSNMIEVIDLSKGAVTKNLMPVQLPAAPKNDTPVGLATRDSTAYVTIAHSDEVVLVKDGKIKVMVSSDTQHAPCWLTLYKSWLYCSNTPSKSISRYDVSADSLTIGQLIAAKTEGEPTDIDADAGVVAVIELGEKTRLSQYQIDSTGALKQLNSVTTSPNANGVAVVTL